MSSLLALAADYLIWPLLTAPLVLWFTHHRRAGIVSTISGLLSWLAALLIKDFFYLPRPYILAGHLPPANYLLDGSFPSGHTALALGVSFAIFYFHRRLGLGLILVSVSIGLARVLSGVHTPADLLGSALIALAASGLASHSSH